MLKLCDLFSLYSQYLAANGEGRDVISRARRALEIFSRANGLKAEAGAEVLIGAIYGDAYELFWTLCKAENSTAYAKHLSAALGLFRQFGVARIDSKSIMAGGNFARTLEALILEKRREGRNWTHEQIADELGLTSTVISNWLRGRGIPGSIETILAIEKFFGLKKCELFSVIPVAPEMRISANLAHPDVTLEEGDDDDDDEGDGFAEINGLRYTLKYDDWNPTLKKQWERLKWYKMTSSDELIEAEVQRTRRARWHSEYSALGTQNYFGAYFGFLCLPENKDPRMSGKGIDPEDIRMSMIVNAGYLKDYAKFRNSRIVPRYRTSDKVQTGTFASYVQGAAAATLITGPFPQMPEIFADTKDHAEWRMRCEKFNRIAAQTSRELTEKGLLVSTKDKLEYLKPILSRPQPIAEIHELIAEIDRNAKLFETNGRGECDKALNLNRDATLLSMMTQLPLRRRALSEMLISDMERQQDGSYVLKLRRETVKNHYNKEYWGRKTVQRIVFSKEISDRIHHYLRHVRPLLLSGGMFKAAGRTTRVNTYFFVSYKTPDNNQYTDFYGRIVKLSRAFAKTKAFGVHSVRHIVATNHVKCDGQDGFLNAASALMDHIDTVRERYVAYGAEDKSKVLIDASERHKQMIGAGGKVQSPEELAKNRTSDVPITNPVNQLFDTFGPAILATDDESKVKKLIASLIPGNDDVEYIHKEALRRWRKARK